MNVWEALAKAYPQTEQRVSWNNMSVSTPTYLLDQV